MKSSKLTDEQKARRVQKQIDSRTAGRAKSLKKQKKKSNFNGSIMQKEKSIKDFERIRGEI